MASDKVRELADRRVRTDGDYVGGVSEKKKCSVNQRKFEELHFSRAKSVSGQIPKS